MFWGGKRHRPAGDQTGGQQRRVVILSWRSIQGRLGTIYKLVFKPDKCGLLCVLAGMEAG